MFPFLRLRNDDGRGTEEGKEGKEGQNESESIYLLWVRRPRPRSVTGGEKRKRRRGADRDF